MEKISISRIAVLVLAVILVSAFALQASAEFYICTPTAFDAVYNTATETVTYSGTYTGALQSDRTYMITLLDANNSLIRICNTIGSELDQGNSKFMYSFSLDDSVLTDFTQPFKAIIECKQHQSIIKTTTTTVVVTAEGTASYTVSFAAGENGSISSTSAITVEEGTLVNDISFPTPTANEGFEFAGWVASEGGVENGVIVANVVFTAQFNRTVLLGDVDGNGTVDNLDAAKLLRYDAGIISTIDEKAADVNKDGEVGNLDASLILKYDCGLIEGF